MTFNGSTNREGTLSILDANSNVLKSVSNTNNISLSYNVTPESAGTLQYTLKAEQGTKPAVSRNTSVQVSKRNYHYMFYGNSDTELTSGADIQALTSSMSNTASDTYNHAYYYIAVHSSKSLVSVINRGVEPVTGNFTLKNDALVVEEYGAEQIYKLYECDINAGADPGDMDTYNLTITIQ